MGLLKENYFFERAALGLIHGVSRVTLLGRNTAISTSTEDVWGPGGSYAQLTTAVAFEVISNSANDAAAGTGAQTVALNMVDGNHAQTTVTATMNGTNAVAITGTYLACNGGRVLTSGSGLTNAGTIDVRVVSGSAIKRQIATGTGSTGRDTDFIYTIPANCSALLRDINWSVTGATGGVTIAINEADTAANRKTALVFSKGIGFTAINDGQGTVYNGPGIPFSEKTLITMACVATAGAGDFVASANLFIFDGSKGAFNL